MQLLGNVKHVSKENLLIARCNSVLSLNLAVRMLKKPVFSERERKIGEISEIFGPVSSPYISIKPKHALASTFRSAQGGLKTAKFAGKNVYFDNKIVQHIISDEN